MSTQVLDDDRIEAVRVMQDRTWNLNMMQLEAAGLILDDQESLKKGLSLSYEVKEKQTEIEAIRKAAIEPSRKYIARINDAAKTIDSVLEQIAIALKNKISLYQVKLERQAQAEQQAAESVLKSLGVAMDMVAVTAPRSFASADVIASSKIKWTFSVENDQLVPLEYLTVDEAKIKKAVSMGVRVIPGVKIFEHKEMQIRRR